MKIARTADGNKMYLSNFPIWIEKIIKELTNNYTQEIDERTMDVLKLQADLFRDWFEETSPDITSLSFKDALRNAQAWKAQEYKSNKIVYKFDNGWKVIQITDPSDLDLESDLLLMEDPGFGRYKFAEELKKGINPKDGKIPEYVIFSLRDAANVPIVYIVGRQTALFNGSQLYSLLGIKGHLLEDPDPEENSGITQVDNHLVPYLKQFFTNLEEKGYKLRSPSDYEDYARVKDLEQDIQISDVPSINLKDEFGLDMSLPNNLEGEGGYLGALGRLGENAIGSPGYGFVRNVAEQGINGLIIYANLVDEMDDLEKAVQDYEENVQEGFYNWTMSIDMENQYPQEDDYYIEPDNKQDQPEFGEEFSGERKFDQERYDEDLRKYDEEMQYLEEDYQPIQIANFFYHKVEEAKVQQSKNNIEMRAKAKDLPAISNLPEIKESTVAKNDNIIKIAAKPVYNADSLAAYIDSLKLFEKEHSDLQKKYQKMIKQLPSSSKIRKDFDRKVKQNHRARSI